MPDARRSEPATETQAMQSTTCILSVLAVVSGEPVVTALACVWAVMTLLCVMLEAWEERRCGLDD